MGHTKFSFFSFSEKMPYYTDEQRAFIVVEYTKNADYAEKNFLGKIYKNISINLQKGGMDIWNFSFCFSN